MFQTKVVEKIKTNFIFNNFSSFENRVFNEIMWKDIVDRGSTQMTLRHIRIACWIPKATNTYLQYVIFIAFPLQQCLNERASMLRILPV
jgi:hypothetical protein